MAKKVDPEISEIFREMGRLGGRARAAKLTPKQRSELAKRAVRTRVERRRAATAFANLLTPRPSRA